MSISGNQRKNKPFLKRHRMALLLALTLAVFGILGALVILAPRTEKLPPSESNSKTPQVRQVERKSLKANGQGPGS